MKTRSKSSPQLSFDFDAIVGNSFDTSEYSTASKECDQDADRTLAMASVVEASAASPVEVGTAANSSLGGRQKPSDRERANETDAEKETVQRDLAILAQYERELLTTRRRVPRRQRIKNDEPCLGAIARQTGTTPSRLRAPAVRTAIAEMVESCGIETVDERTFAKEILRRIEDLGDRLRRDGQKMPRNTMYPDKPNFTQVGRLIGVGLWALSDSAKQRVSELYLELGVQDPKLTRVGVLLLAWADRAREEGLKVPASSSLPTEPYIPLCAEVMNISRASLYWPSSQAILRELGRELGFEIAPTARETKPLPTLVRVQEWHEEAKRNGRKVPQHPKAPGHPWFGAACEQIGIHSNSALQPIVRDAIVKAGSELGYEYLEGKIARDAPTLEELRPKAIAMREREVEGQSSARAQIANFRSAMNQLAKLNPDGELAEVRTLLDQGASIRAGDSKFHGELRVIKRCLEQMVLAAELPQSFCEALRELRRRINLPYWVISREAGLSRSAVKGWSRKCPSAKRRRDVEEVEKVLKVEPLTLVSRMKAVSQHHPRIRLSHFPEEVRGSLELRTKVKSRLEPAERGELDEAFPARCQVIADEIRSETKPRQLFVKSPPYALHKLPPQVAQQFNIIRDVATPDGAKRRQATLEGFFDEKLIWEKTTAGKHERELKCFFGYLAQADGPREGLKIDDMTLALAVVPALALRFPLWIEKRRTPIGGGRVTRVSDSMIFSLFATLLRPDGILRRMPELAGTLKPIPGILEADEIADILKDWDAACERARLRYSAVIRTYRPDDLQDADDIASLMPVLNLKNPSQAVTHLMLRRMQETRRLMEVGTLYWALLVRDELYVQIQDRMAFRTGTLQKLKSSYFCVRQDTIELNVPRSHFKNRKSKKVWKRGRRWHDFHRDFGDELGSHEVFWLYVNVARPILEKEGTGESEAFFLTRTGKPMLAFSNLANRLSHTFLLNWPDEDSARLSFWRSQRPLQNHDFRHILATTILRQDRDWAAAADALKDTVETVERHYAFLRLEDESARLSEVLRARYSPEDRVGLRPTLKPDDIIVIESLLAHKPGRPRGVESAGASLREPPGG